MDGKELAMNILKAFGVILGIIGILGAITLTAFIITLVLGAIFYTAESGDLPVGNNTTSTLSDIEAGFISNMGNITTATGFGLQLLTVVVILIIFGSLVYIGVKKYKGGSKNQGGY